MKFNALLAALLCPVAAAAMPRTFTGTWNQVYSNNYVQTTTEIDWKCIKVYTYLDKNTDLAIFKVAHLHGGPQVVVTPVVSADLRDNKITVKGNPRASNSPVKIDSTYDIHPYSNDTVVITGDNNPALYVWTREGSDEEPVDIPRLLAFADKLGFQLHKDQIVPTYNRTTC